MISISPLFDFEHGPHGMTLLSAITITSGGADVAIEALGLQETFENCLR